MPQDSDQSPIDFPRLIQDAVAEAVANEDPERFMAWFRAHVSDYETESSDGAWNHAAFVAVLGRSIWNALPLPGNGFRPRPMPEPGRNDPCFCGSEVKYKRCCAESPAMTLDPEAILPTVLEHTPREALADHIRAGRAPIPALVQVATERFQRGELWNTVDLLEPLFAGQVRRPDEHHGRALDLLCDLYVELGHKRKKHELLDRIVQTTNRSPLRSDAWQRISVARLDEGDADGAWEAFHQARQDHPDAPGIGLLEIQLLMSRGRAEEARERAGFWEKRLRRQGHGDDDRLVSFFARMTRDPHGVMADMGVKAAGGAGERLRTWLGEVAGRPLPDYEALDGPAAAPAPDEPDAPDHADDNAGDLPASLCLCPPEPVTAVDGRWHEVFPLEKPFSIQDDPVQQDDPWAPAHEQQWMALLERYPEAFDSLDILDDLATALTRHPQFGAEWLDHALLEPVLARAEAIVDRALRDRSGPPLSWLYAENRPALRSLARRVYLQFRRGDTTGAARAAEWLLALNPGDNHGFRTVVVDHRLRHGDDEGALAITEQYPGDLNPECAFGRVLALYRLQRLDEAQAVLCEAVEHLPELVRYLTAQRVKKPTVHRGHVTVGGKDQAWLYREAMRDVWQATPDALAWLKQAEKRC